MTRPVRFFLYALGAYLLLVISFETFIGFVQFEAQRPLEIITVGGDGHERPRMLGRFEDADRVYASAHHWPRRWYRDAVAQGEVDAVIDGVRSRYRVVAIEDPEEHARLDGVFPLPVPFRFVTGFPPRAFLRLDPVGAAR